MTDGSLQLAAFLRTTLPLDLGRLTEMDDGRYHSIWMPDHLVSFWPDALWTPEFTDLAHVSSSPHRHLDALSVAGAVAAQTERAAIATSVVDTVRRHPVMLAQAAVTLSHLSSGRFILGIGSGEKENIEPYGFDFDRAVSRFEEAVEVIRLLWQADGPVHFDGRFFHLDHARLDTELFDGDPPPLWIGANGPRMLRLAGRFADGWWPTGSDGPEEYAAKLALVRRAADDAGRDPSGIVAAKMVVCLLGEADEIEEMMRQPLVRSLALQLPAESFAIRGHRHPMGDRWRGIQDVDPGALSRERLLRLFDDVDPTAILSIVPHGTPKEVARDIADLHEAGMEVASILDYSGMAGQAYAARSAPKVRETEVEALRLANGGQARWTRLAPIDADALFERAQRETGLSDFGDDSLHGRVELVVDAVRDSGLDAAGEAAAADTIHWLLTSRLGFYEDRRVHPLAEEQIVRPVFATGEPRSGTTLLHALLSVDPAARALRFWEVMYPSPPPGLAGPGDRRRERADADWRDILERIPPWIVSHPYNDMLGDGLPECERTWAFDFRSMTPSAWWRVPMTMRPALPQDPVTQYRIHRMVLQHVQHGRPERHWVLKGFHGQRLAALFDTYPDASVIWVHRDPVKVIASQITAFGQINECLAGSLDWEGYALSQLETARRSIHAHLAEPLVDDPRIHHVPYQDFVADPVAAIGDFHHRFRIPFTTETAAAMRQYLAENAGDRHGRFRYSTDVLPVDVGALDEEFRPYRERFGVELERRG